MPMDPWIEVSTVGGKNMRETCARVLAAGLMTGAIATLVGMAAHLGTPSVPARPIAAPPSALQRTVRLTARPAPAPEQRRSAARLVTAHTTHVQAPPRVIRPSLAVVRRNRAPRPAPRRQLAATTTAPPPVATAAPAPVPAAAAPPPQPPAPPADDQGDAGDHGQGHGRGHAHGHDEQDD